MTIATWTPHAPVRSRERPSLRFAAFMLGLVVAAGGAGSACARAVFVPPAGPGVSAPDGPAAWTEATGSCRNATSYAAAIRLSGRAGGQRLWPVTVDTAVLADQSIYLGATAAGRGVFVLAGSGGRATLWLRREQRTVAAAPAEILDAVVGVSLTPRDLLAVLSGCGVMPGDVTSAERHGALLTVQLPGARVHLTRRGGRWRVKGAENSSFVVECADAGDPLPRELWLWPATRSASDPSTSLHLIVEDPEAGGQIPVSVFRLPAAAGEATPMTLDELRSGAPWKNR
jgi:hypothetical protein